MVALAVSGVVMLVVMDSFLAMHEQKTQLLAEVELRENFSIALTSIRRDILFSDGVVGGRGESGTTEELLAAHDLTLYCLRADQTLQTIKYTIAVDPVGAVHPYALRGLVLYRAVNGGVRQPVANFIDQLTFAYYDQTGQPTSRSSQVAIIEVRLKGQTDLEQLTRNGRIELKKQNYR